MQVAAYGTKRDAGPILWVMLGFMAVTAVLGVTCLGMGAKIGDDLASAKSFGSAFWWGGLVVLILAGLYVPCHFLVKSGNPSGRALFFVWTFFVVVGVICILISALLSGLVYVFVKDINAGRCTYITSNNTYTPADSPCRSRCESYFTTTSPRTCCCCFDDRSDTTLVYIKGVDSCESFKTSKELAGALTYIYVIIVILLFILMVMAYVVACGCCDIQQPWVVYTQVSTTTTAPPAYGSTEKKY